MKKRRKFNIPTYKVEGQVNRLGLVIKIERTIQHDNLTFGLETRLFKVSNRLILRAAKGIKP